MQVKGGNAPRCSRLDYSMFWFSELVKRLKKKKQPLPPHEKKIRRKGPENGTWEIKDSEYFKDHWI